MNTINTHAETRPGTVQRDEDLTSHQNESLTRWDEGNTPESLAVEDQTDVSRHEAYGDTDGTFDQGLDRETTSDSPFNQAPLAAPTPMGAPVPADRHDQVTTDGNPVHDNTDEVIRIVHNEGEDKPWELKFGEGISGFQKIRAMLNYPLHKFETEAKAQEVAEMLRGIINADAVEQDGRVISRDNADDKQEFFHPVSEHGESPPGVERDTR